MVGSACFGGVMILRTVKSTTRNAALGTALIVGIAAWWWRAEAPRPREETQAHASEAPAAIRARPAGAPRAERSLASPGVRTLPPPLSDAEKAARIEKIKRDYDEIRTKAAADYSAAGANFPGGLNAFLRQLALLEREKRSDFAAFLNPRELENLEYRETTAGQLVQRLFGDTPATDEQRRAVFRLQLEFEDRFALTFDLSPAALLERETARQQLQQKIRGVVGDALFAAWLRGEGADFANFSRFVAQQGMPQARSFELWEIKNEFIRRRLELGVQKLPPQQLRTLQGALSQETRVRVMSVLGPGTAQLANREVLGWLPAEMKR